MDSTNRGWLIVLGVLVLIVLLSPLLGGGLLGWGGMMGPGMMWGAGSAGGPAFGGWGWGLAMGLGWLTMLAFWGAVIIGIVLLVRWLSRPAPGAPPRGDDDALTILRRRFASGEITQEQYEQMRRTLDDGA